MIEISINKINKNYGFNPVLKDFSMEIKSGERIAFIGSNGCGKTTTLRIVMGLETIDSGTINIRKGSKIGYLTQIPPKEKDNIKARDVFMRGIKELIDLESEINNYVSNMDSSTKSIKTLDRLQEEFRIKGGYQIKEKINKIKGGFKLSDELLDTEYNNLSGGEKTIVNLASLVLSEPDVLLLDEPTNHLDPITQTLIAKNFKEYDGTIILVSHNKNFIENVGINRILLLPSGKIINYKEEVLDDYCKKQG